MAERSSVPILEIVGWVEQNARPTCLLQFARRTTTFALAPQVRRRCTGESGRPNSSRNEMVHLGNRDRSAPSNVKLMPPIVLRTLNRTRRAQEHTAPSGPPHNPQGFLITAHEQRAEPGLAGRMT